jgi:glutamate synthase domain-containing protein 2
MAGAAVADNPLTSDYWRYYKAPTKLLLTLVVALGLTMQRPFFLIAGALFGAVLTGGYFWAPLLWALLVLGPLFLVGLMDLVQTDQAVRRNLPVIGTMRYLFEMIRPEISQYFIESNTDGMPFSRESRSVVYQRAKRALDTTPFGTQRDLYEVGSEWLQHSLGARAAHELKPDITRVKIGRPGTAKPYEASLLNISAMSYGSLSKNAIEALSMGAKEGGFSHNTGEGGINPYHLRGGADLVW